MTTASDALFTIGGIIDDYYRNGLMKFFKVTRYTLAKHIISLIISRVIIVLFSSALVFSLALAIGQLHFSFRDVAFILFGISSAFIIFALTGIIVAEIIKEHSSNSGILNMIFYGVIFLSNTFYPLTDLNPTFNVIVLFNPITPSLELARGVIHPVPLIAWIAALTLFHTVFSINSHIKR